MRLEAVTICVDYSDFLAHAMPLNRPLFDDWVIVTAPHDRATQRLCEHYHVRCLVTEAFYSGGDKFNKGRGINAGLESLRGKDFLLHLDADIVLPPRTRDFLERAMLDPECLYGIDRLMCPDRQEWIKYLQSPTPRFSDEIFIAMGPWPVGERIAKRDAGGYLPIGFFQLWHAAAGDAYGGPRRYPEHHSTAARSDMLFSLEWARQRRALLPEIVAIHLGTGPNEAMGANWNGRTTPEFGAAS